MLKTFFSCNIKNCFPRFVFDVWISSLMTKKRNNDVDEVNRPHSVLLGAVSHDASRSNLDQRKRYFKIYVLVTCATSRLSFPASRGIFSIVPLSRGAMLSLRRIKTLVFARLASPRREFSAGLAVQKQSFLFS